MVRRTAVAATGWLLGASLVGAQEVGSAAGKGAIEHLVPAETEQYEVLDFTPHYAFAYGEGTGAKRFTWIVLTAKEPPAKSWAAAADAAEARRLWCEQEKTPFVAVKLDHEWKVDLYFLCPANGIVNTEMLSTWNGLDSVVVRFDVRDDKRLKGSLRTGTGSCPDAEGSPAYCKATGDYEFDAPFLN